MTLYGRDAELADVIGASARVVVVAGDSGTGKSELLQQARLASDGALCPAVVALRRSPGALQMAFLTALANGVAEVVTDAGAARVVGTHLRSALRRLAATHLRDIAEGVGAMLAHAVRERIGDKAMDALRDFTSELKTSVDERLAARIASAGDQDVVDVLRAFAEDLAAAAAGRTVVLTIDNGERLADDDFRRVQDLATALPAAVTLRLGFATADPASRQRADDLRLAGAHVLTLPGLAADAVASWLAAEDDLVAADPVRVHHVTVGYPLHIAAAITHLRGGGELRDLPADEALAVFSRRAFEQLDSPTQQIVAQLAAFADPVPNDRIPALVGVAEADWPAIERRLTTAGVFVESSGRRWFHELRRRHIWASLLTDAERTAAAQRAIGDLAERINSGVDITGVPLEVVRLLRETPAMTADAPVLARVLTADRAELAILGALVELVEPQRGDNAADASSALMYARDAFSNEARLVTALERLSEANLVFVAQRDDVAVAVPRWLPGLLPLVIAGRVAEEFGRLPIPSLATAVFDTALRPAAGEFLAAHYGIGAPSVTELSRQMTTLHRQDDGTYVSITPGTPTVAASIRYGDIDLFSAIAYLDKSGRDAAVRDLDGRESALLGTHIAVQAMALPADPVPSRRLLLAAERLLDRSIGRSERDAPPAPDGMGLDEAMRRRAATLDAVSAILSPRERVVLRLDGPQGLVYGHHISSGGTLIGYVNGRSGALRLDAPPMMRWDDPYFALRLAEAANLAKGEYVGNVNYHSSYTIEDPFLAVLLRLHRKAVAFNRPQGTRINVELAEEPLRAAIEAAMTQARVDAERLAPHVTSAVTGPLGQLLYVAVLLAHPDGGEWPTVVNMAAPTDGADQLHLRIYEPGTEPPLDNHRALWNDAFGSIAPPPTGWSWADAYIRVAELLGYSDGEVAFS